MGEIFSGRDSILLQNFLREQFLGEGPLQGAREMTFQEENDRNLISGCLEGLLRWSEG